ncbi:hypothetical protein [Halomicrococcus sp. NG-SE-24]|uniref:hypothetical protein n=1 Tax=Halomicrococcus sp. NG-SE-24 TaxID=3436928 RepID=UPI003D96FC15
MFDIERSGGGHGTTAEYERTAVLEIRKKFLPEPRGNAVGLFSAMPPDDVYIDETRVSPAGCVRHHDGRIDTRRSECLLDGSLLVARRLVCEDTYRRFVR